MEFLGIVFTNFIDENLRRWREELELPVAIKRSFLSSYKWKKISSDIRSVDSFRSKLFAKVISWFNSFPLNKHGLRILSSVFSDRNVWPQGQRAEIRERIASKSLQTFRTKFYEIAGHVRRVKTVVTNHLGKMFRSRIHKAAKRNIPYRINSDKLTETSSSSFHKPFVTGVSNNLLTVI